MEGAGEVAPLRDFREWQNTQEVSHVGMGEKIK